MDYTPLEGLKIYKLKFVCQAKTLLHQGPFWGSALHGVLGQSLKQMLCLNGTKKCDACPEKASCSYQRIFHPAMPQGHPHQRKYADMPQPFIIQKDMFDKVVFLPGDQFSFGFNLVGSAINDFKHFCEAFIHAGKTGMGRMVSKFDVIQILCDPGGNDEFLPLGYGDLPKPVNHAAMVFPKNIPSAKLCFVTPLHLKEQGIVVDKPSFQLLLHRLYERQVLLNHFYCDGDIPENVNFGSPEIETRHQLQSYPFARFSNRHEKLLKLSGLLGNISLSGNMDKYIPLLFSGSLVNVGKMATLGLGQYRLCYG